jgi:hypothetical protein
MLMQTRDFADVAAKARAFGCRVPVGVALLPGNFATATHAGEFCFHAATPHIRSAWQSVGLEDEGPHACDLDLPNRAEGSVPDAPSARMPLAVFFGPSLLGGQVSRLAVALGIASTVLASHPGCASPREVLCDVVVERPGSGYACLEYQGDAYGLAELVGDVRRVWKA